MANDLEENKRAEVIEEPNLDPLLDKTKVNMFDSKTIEYKGVVITISDTALTEEDSVMAGRTSEEALLLSSDILRTFSGETSFEEQIDVNEAIRETLQTNYGWSNIEWNTFIRILRRNLYLRKIGEENKSDINLKEFKRLNEFLDRKESIEVGDIEVGDSSNSIAEAMREVEDQENLK